MDPDPQPARKRRRRRREQPVVEHPPAPLPAEPTDALPGTPAKLAEMERRAAARQALFHPGDQIEAKDLPVELPPCRVRLTVRECQGRQATASGEGACVF